MKYNIVIPTAILCLASQIAFATPEAPSGEVPSKHLSPEMVSRVSPPFAHFTKDTLLDEVWKRPGLSPRDRSLITIAVLISKSQTVEMPFHFNLALENGITPSELSEIITHLAFYTGWANANQAVIYADFVFDKRGVRHDETAPASLPLLDIDKIAEEQRLSRVNSDVAPVSQGLAKYTNEILFDDLWRRPGLSARDRSMITVAALIATGQFGQVSFHLNRAMDNGVTKAQASEMLTHLAFYTGWPNVFSAVPIVKDVFAKRKL